MTSIADRESLQSVLTKINGLFDDTAAADARLSSVEATSDGNSTAIGVLDTRVDAAETTISANTADIATNTADISTNTADIATNTADIAVLNERTNNGIPGTVTSKSSGFTAVAGDRGRVFHITATLTASLTAAATLADGWYADFYVETGTLTIDPAGAETISGASTLSVMARRSVRVVCDGSAFYTVGLTVSMDSQPAFFVDTYADLDALTSSDVAVGGYVTVTDIGATYQAVSSGEHITTAGGLKLVVLPGASGSDVRAFGAVGDGVTDDTAAIQAAMDSSPKALLFPAGTYNVSAVSGDCLTLSNNTNLIGLAGQQETRIVGYMSGNTTGAVLKVRFTGSGDFRNWTLRGMGIFPQPGEDGKDGLYIADDGQAMLTCQIVDCLFGRNETASGNAAYIGSVFAHGLIEGNTFSGPVFAACGDANKFSNNLSFGGATEFGYTFDLVSGVRNNIVRDCTIVNQGGALRVIDGQEIRFVNNQCEQSGGVNGNTVEAMVWIEGQTRTVENTVIAENNFGGGTNYKRSVYIDNAYGTKIINGNRFIAPGQDSVGGNADVYVTANGVDTIIDAKNFVQESSYSGRHDAVTPLSLIDSGIGTTNSTRSLSMLNGWTCGGFFKDEAGVVKFRSKFESGTTTAGTVVANLPEGYWPAQQLDATRRNLLESTSDFSTSQWVRNNVTVVADAATSPDEKLGYQEVLNPATSAIHFIRDDGTSLPNTSQRAVSFYVQRTSASTVSQIRGLFDGPTGNATFTVNLVTGAVAATASGGASVSASSTASGSGWRVVLLYTPAATGVHYLRFTPANQSSVYNTYLGVPATDSFLLWGPQVEDGSSATAYQNVISATKFSTPIFEKPFLVQSSGSAGEVTISNAGEIKVVSLSSADFEMLGFQSNLVN